MLKRREGSELSKGHVSGSSHLKISLSFLFFFFFQSWHHRLPGDAFWAYASADCNGVSSDITTLTDMHYAQWAVKGDWRRVGGCDKDKNNRNQIKRPSCFVSQQMQSLPLLFYRSLFLNFEKVVYFLLMCCVCCVRMYVWVCACVCVCVYVSLCV